MYKHILTCVDGSPSSKLALQQAIQLAREQHASLRLLCVVDWASTPDIRHEYDLHGFVTSERAETASEAGERILREAQGLAQRYGVQADTVMLDLTISKIADVIVDEAKRSAADLIVIGTHGRRGVGRLMVGSVAEGVIRASPVPVLTIRG
jgi:nucleotide-binding universal stress UspA family protein